MTKRHTPKLDAARRRQQQATGTSLQTQRSRYRELARGYGSGGRGTHAPAWRNWKPPTAIQTAREELRRAQGRIDAEVRADRRKRVLDSLTPLERKAWELRLATFRRFRRRSPANPMLAVARANSHMAKHHEWVVELNDRTATRLHQPPGQRRF